MSSVNYNLNNKGVRLISPEDAWIKPKNSRYKLNLNYKIIGKIEMTMPNMILTASEKVKQKEP